MRLAIVSTCAEATSAFFNILLFTRSDIKFTAYITALTMPVIFDDRLSAFIASNTPANALPTPATASVHSAPIRLPTSPASENISPMNVDTSCVASFSRASSSSPSSPCCLCCRYSFHAVRSVENGFLFPITAFAFVTACFMRSISSTVSPDAVSKYSFALSMSPERTLVDVYSISPKRSAKPSIRSSLPTAAACSS